MSPLPEAFIENLTSHFGNETASRVLESLTLAPSVSVRVNPRKPTSQFSHETPVAWSSLGFVLKQRPDFYLDPLFHAGSYYVQDSSSMIVETVVKSLSFESKSVLALDLCAAPGGKTISIADAIGPDSFVIANEIDTKRNAILSENILKWGLPNHAVTQLSSEQWLNTNMRFDLILVDAPCSGEGMFRKDSFAVEQWSTSLVKQCVATQQRLLADTIELLEVGGYMIYSTCTMNKEENEQQVLNLLEHGMELNLPDMRQFSDQIKPAIVDDKNVGFYLLPGISSGEGLFFSVLKKQESEYRTPKIRPLKLASFIAPDIIESIDFQEFNRVWFRSEQAYGSEISDELLARISDSLHFKSIGLPSYEMKGKSMIPLHGLAMLPSSKPDIELDLENSLQFLRKQSISLPPNSGIGWKIVGYNGVSLGWLKIIPGRSNNYYPSYFRLRS